MLSNLYILHVYMTLNLLQKIKQTHVYQKKLSLPYLINNYKGMLLINLSIDLLLAVIYEHAQ